MSRKTKVTTVVNSVKNADGEWVETDKSVTTVTEFDQDGYPYTFQRPRFTPKSRFPNPYDYFGSFEGFRIQPVRNQQDNDNT